MPLENGTRLGHYEVVAAIGSGGMGEVYRARDTKLGREVAAKVLPEAFLHDTDRIARFEREAKALAALNHPHIAALYEMAQDGGRQFLVMELIEGITLRDLISSGSLPLEQTLDIAHQIADALEAPDGTRFIAVVDATQNQDEAPVAPQLHVVLNWFDELKQRVPGHR